MDVEERVYQAASSEPLTIYAIAERAGLSLPETQAALVVLELKGRIYRLVGNLFRHRTV